MRCLTLVVPGLLGPELPPGVPAGTASAMTEGLELPALARVLARADRAGPVAAPDRELFALAGIDVAADADLPAAAVALLGEGRDPGDAWWMRADPVHLRADLSDLVLADPSQLALETTEAARLVAALDAHFAEDGLRFEIGAPGRWYLRLARAPELSTHSPAEATGRAVSSTLPAGADAIAWHGRINEAQMLLHASDVNRERAARGMPAVNSIWPWGGGRLPAPPAVTVVDAFAGGGVLGRGLARLAGASWEDLPDAFAQVDAAGHTVVVVGAPGIAARQTDVEGWHRALEALEAGWIAPALDALRARRLETLELRSRRTGLVRLTRAANRRFWRRARPLAAHVEAVTRTAPAPARGAATDPG